MESEFHGPLIYSMSEGYLGRNIDLGIKVKVRLNRGAETNKSFLGSLTE